MKTRTSRDRSLIVDPIRSLIAGLAQGTIYYRTNGGVRAMSASGTNDRLVFSGSMAISPLDQKTHNAQPACSLLAQGGTPRWLNLLDDDPANSTGSNYYKYGTLYGMTADAAGKATLTPLSDFDFTNRKVGLVFAAQPSGIQWADGDTFISFLVADYTGLSPLLKIVRFPANQLGVTAVNETTVVTVLAVPAEVYSDEGYLQHAWSPDGTLLAYRNLYTYTLNSMIYSQLVLRQVATGAEQVLLDQRIFGSDIGSIEYSPDGTRTAFAGNAQNVYTITDDGASLRLVAAAGASRSGISTWYDRPNWSPDSTGLAIEMATSNTFSEFYYYLAKVVSTGGKVTNLTPKLSAALPIAWR